MRARIRSVLLALALAPCVGAAQTPEPPTPEVRFAVEAGYVPLTSTAFEYWRHAGGIGGEVEWSLVPVVSLWGRVGYARAPLDDESAAHHVYTQGPLLGLSGGDLSMLGLQAGVRLRPAAGRLRPFFDVGAGVERLSASDMTVRYSHFATGQELGYRMRFSDDTEPSFTAGAGLLYQLRPALGIFASAHIDLLFTEGETTRTFPIRVGVLFK